MEKLKSSLTNMVAVLTVIAVVAGAVLAYVNAVTEPKIKDINDQNLKEGLNTVLGLDKKAKLEVSETDTIYKAKLDENKKPIALTKEDSTEGNIQFIKYVTAKGIAVSSITNGFGGPLKVLVGFDDKGNVKGYTILATSETPGLGAKAQDWFQDKVIGKNPGADEKGLQVSKDDPKKEVSVDAITASTITSRAFLKAINEAYNLVFRPQDANTSATESTSKQDACKDGKADCCKSDTTKCCKGDSTKCSKK